MSDSQSRLAVYIHWPFCRKKCPYCDFNSHVREAAVDHPRWAAALARELRYYRELTGAREVTSIFFGGGTPSLMMPETVKTCIDTIYQLWTTDKNLEVTLEANPTSAEANKFEAFREAGVNRLSIGVQSLNETDLVFLGREHSAQEAISVIKMARQIYDRVSFDLMYGRPEQKPADWAAELEEALALDPDHISVYQLTIEQGTEFYTRAQRGDFVMPTSDLEAEFYELTQKILAKYGLPAYEISNHASPGQECRHNLAYWRYDDFIGVGPGAHGRFVDRDGQRLASRAHKVPEIWLDRVERDNHGAHPFEPIADETAFEEMVMMGLRLTEGVSLSDLRAKTGFSLTDKIDHRKLEQLVAENILNLDEQFLKCTPDGLKMLNSVLRYLL